MHEIRIQAVALDALRILQERHQRQVAEKIERLAVDPRAGNYVKRLKGEWAGYWRLRSGDFRVIYLVDDENKVVTVTWIGNRRDAPYD